MQNKNQLYIREMPKVELHVHLEGAFTHEFLFELIQKYGGDPDVASVNDLAAKFEFQDFRHFIETWVWKNKFFRQPQDFEDCTYATLKNLHEQNVVYVEAFYSPWDFLGNDIKVEEITEATLSGIRRARDEFDIRCALIADIIRDLGAKTALERVRQVVPFVNSGVIGVGLGGSEQKFPPEPFADAFKLAINNGLRVVAHAGEAAGPESIWAAIDALRAERIGHGVRAIEDENLINALADMKIPLEICVTSNLKTSVFPSYKKHPVRDLFKKGLIITINSDDPTMFGSSLTDEFFFLHDYLKFSIKEINQLVLNAVESSFLEKDDKEKLAKNILSNQR